MHAHAPYVKPVVAPIAITHDEWWLIDDSATTPLSVTAFVMLMFANTGGDPDYFVSEDAVGIA